MKRIFFQSFVMQVSHVAGVVGTDGTHDDRAVGPCHSPPRPLYGVTHILCSRDSFRNVLIRFENVDTVMLYVSLDCWIPPADPEHLLHVFTTQARFGHPRFRLGWLFHSVKS
jgi:hypothetical protein